ncbi:MAG: aldo/keto reductase [Kineosporiaceae bacterium]|nr:aldo/keto reductase [Aeromicrobium sp.]
MTQVTQRSIGKSDIAVSVVGLGCNAFGSRIDATQTQSVVDAAIDHGITFFDTADSYGTGASEELLGAALSSRRTDVVIATKFGMAMDGTNGPEDARASKAYMRKAVESSLRRLGTDYIDLYQLHTPDRVTPIADTLGAMGELIDEGLVRYVGCSNLTAWELVEADWTARTWGFQSFVSAQNEYSLYNRAAEVELAPACQHLGVGILPYFPLAYGLLTGKYHRGESAPEGSRLANDNQRSRLKHADWDRVEALEAFAAERGLSILQVAMGGLAAQPAVASVIAGATKPEQIAANVEAASWQPSADDLEALAGIGRPKQSYTTFAPRR